MSLVATWSYLVIEVAFNSIGESPPTSIVVRISSATGTVINLCSTQPDENLDLPVNPGPNVARLRFPKLPLAAGEYVAEIAIAITNVEVVSLIEVKFSVEPTDVFKSGTAPSARRFPVVFDHCWELGVDPVTATIPSVALRCCFVKIGPACAICGSKRARMAFSTSEYSISICQDCTLGWTCPPPGKSITRPMTFTLRPEPLTIGSYLANGR